MWKALCRVPCPLEESINTGSLLNLRVTGGSHTRQPSIPGASMQLGKVLRISVRVVASLQILTVMGEQETVPPVSNGFFLLV